MDPVIIDWRETGTSQWITLPPEDFVVAPGSIPRDVLVTAVTDFDFKEGFDYRIRPAPGILKCSNVTGSPDVAEYEYILHGQ